MINYLLNKDSKKYITESALLRLSEEGFKLSHEEYRYLKGWKPDLCVPTFHAASSSRSPYRQVGQKMLRALQRAKKLIAKNDALYKEDKPFSFRHLTGQESDYITQSIAIRLKDAVLGNPPSALPIFDKDEYCDKQIPHQHMQMVSWLIYVAKCHPSANSADHDRYNQQLQEKIIPTLKQAIKNGMIEKTLQEAVQRIKATRQYHAIPVAQPLANQAYQWQYPTQPIGYSNQAQTTAPVYAFINPPPRRNDSANYDSKFFRTLKKHFSEPAMKNSHHSAQVPRPVPAQSHYYPPNGRQQRISTIPKPLNEPRYYPPTAFTQNSHHYLKKQYSAPNIFNNRYARPGQPPAVGSNNFTPSPLRQNSMAFIPKPFEVSVNTRSKPSIEHHDNRLKKPRSTPTVSNKNHNKQKQRPTSDSERVKEHRHTKHKKISGQPINPTPAPVRR